MKSVAESVEPLLALALEEARLRRMVEAARLLAACTVILDLYRPPSIETYNPAAAIKTQLETLEDESHTFTVEPVHDCVGDAKQMLECLRLLVEGAALPPDTALVVEVFETNDAPSIALSFDGPGSFPTVVSIEATLDISLEELAERWTAATRGGRIDSVPNGLILRLSGVRMPPEIRTGLDPLREAAEAALKACDESPELACAAIETALRAVDVEESPRSPADLKVVMDEILSAHTAVLTQDSIVPESLVTPDLPPIVMHRRRIARFFDRALEYSERILANGGAVILLADYDQARRLIEITITAEGKDPVPREACLVASMRRAIVDAHGGAFDVQSEASGVTMSATLPDPVGRELDAWIPGFECFSARSRQVLRLLKSGGEALPEAVFLAGVLEEELERWLLPRFADPAAINLAHEMPADNRALPGSVPERAKKALDQIRRGKPRKEIAKPAYAAEILFAFHREERHRKSLGIEKCSDADISQLCANLLQSPPRYIECLKFIARVPSTSTPSTGSTKSTPR